MTGRPSLVALAVGGGRVDDGPTLRLALPAGAADYADAQLDDLSGVPRHALRWRPPLTLRLRARYGPVQPAAVGTAGFGFWNAPYGDPRRRWPALPVATWFFYAAAPNSLPFLHHNTGWFAATIDMRRARALPGALLALPLLLANHSARVRQTVWPRVLRLFGVACVPLAWPAAQWQTFVLDWRADGCRFAVDGRPLLVAPAPAGPLGFVAWIDNQYLRATPTGRLAAGITPTPAVQWLEMADLTIEPALQRQTG